MHKKIFFLLLPALLTAAGMPMTARAHDSGKVYGHMPHHADLNRDGRVSKCERRFDRIDRNNDGRISKRERRLDRMDRNRDGRISKSERRFDRIDANNDGHLSRREIRRAYYWL